MGWMAGPDRLAPLLIGKWPRRQTKVPMYRPPPPHPPCPLWGGCPKLKLGRSRVVSHCGTHTKKGIDVTTYQQAALHCCFPQSTEMFAVGSRNPRTDYRSSTQDLDVREGCTSHPSRKHLTSAIAGRPGMGPVLLSSPSLPFPPLPPFTRHPCGLPARCCQGTTRGPPNSTPTSAWQATPVPGRMAIAEIDGARTSTFLDGEGLQHFDVLRTPRTPLLAVPARDFATTTTGEIREGGGVIGWITLWTIDQRRTTCAAPFDWALERGRASDDSAEPRSAHSSMCLRLASSLLAAHCTNYCRCLLGMAGLDARAVLAPPGCRSDFVVTDGSPRGDPASPAPKPPKPTAASSHAAISIHQQSSIINKNGEARRGTRTASMRRSG